MASLIAVGAWFSLNPYFVWDSFPLGMLLSAAFGGVALVCLVSRRMLRPLSKGEVIGLSLFTLFILYITLQPRVDGGHSKWVLVLPIAWCVCLACDEQRSRCYGAFAMLFAVTLIPGILVSLASAAGMPLTFTAMPAANPRFAAEGVRLLHFPGALFTESNSMLLPNGGVLFRMQGIYDEPGTVGTTAALLLAVIGFRILGWRPVVLFVAGVLSFSLAFAVLATVGVVSGAVLRRRWHALLLLLPIVGAAALSLGYLRVPALPRGQTSSASVVTLSGSRAPVAANRQQLRQQEYINNRTLPAMKALIDAYWSAPPSVLLLGFASDASVVRGGVSQTWMRILTDHGLLGFATLASGIGLILWRFFSEGCDRASAVVFVFIFAMSGYQRPVIWVPYATLLLFCGAAVAARCPSTET